MNVGVNYLREHVPDDTRIHYAYIDAGGIAPNVVQARARIRYSVRARELSSMLSTLERVKDVARGAALMTGTEVDIITLSAVSNLLPNPPLEEAMQETMLRLGPPVWDARRPQLRHRHPIQPRPRRPRHRLPPRRRHPQRRHAPA